MRCQHHGWLFAAGVLVAMALLLFPHPEQNFFYFQMSGITEVRALISAHTFPWSGPRIMGEPLHLPGPLYLLILTAIYRSWPFVRVAYLVFGLLQLIAAAGTFFVGRRFFGVRVGLLWMALFATDWTAVFVGRDHENIACLAPFIVLLIGASLELLVRARSTMVLVILPAFAAGVQLHLSMLSLAPPLLWAIVCARQSIRTRHLVASLLLVLFIFAPYLFHGLFEDRSALLGLIEHPRLHRTHSYLRVLGEAFLIEPRFWSHRLVVPFDLRFGAVPLIAIGWRFVLSVCAVFEVLRRIRRSPLGSSERAVVLFLALGAVGPYLLWSLSERLMAVHYLIPEKQFLLLSTALAASSLLVRLKTPPQRAIVGTLLALFFVGSAITETRAYLPHQEWLLPEPNDLYRFLDKSIEHEPIHLTAYPRFCDSPLFDKPVFDAK